MIGLVQWKTSGIQHKIRFLISSHSVLNPKSKQCRQKTVQNNIIYIHGTKGILNGSSLQFGRNMGTVIYIATFIKINSHVTHASEGQTGTSMG